MTSPVSPGLHHVTAVTDNAQANLNFHVGVLGMRFVKLTVNFDDPGTHHLYYGDDAGKPGTALTYFPWQGMGPGTPGAGETLATALAVPPDSLGYWTARLQAAGVATTTAKRFGGEVLAFASPDGMRFELVETGNTAAFTPAREVSVDPARAIRGFHSVSLLSRRPEKTAAVLTDLFGYKVQGVDGDRTRLVSSAGAEASVVDVVAAPAGTALAELGAGSVHHVAFRSSAADHLKFQEKVAAAGLRITPPQERVYFRSLYFREPGGVLFEIATDSPGFTVDEPLDSLGRDLKLPPWLEPQRALISARLPKLTVPSSR